jgi:transposase
MAQVEALSARGAELEAKLGHPPKTPDNSSLPPSNGHKPSAPVAPKPKRKPMPAGAGRFSQPLTAGVSRRTCQRCGVDVSGSRQFACERYDRIEIRAITREVSDIAGRRLSVLRQPAGLRHPGQSGEPQPSRPWSRHPKTVMNIKCL